MRVNYIRNTTGDTTLLNLQRTRWVQVGLLHRALGLLEHLTHTYSDIKSSPNISTAISSLRLQVEVLNRRYELQRELIMRQRAKEKT